jgi:hypothetical protein
MSGRIVIRIALIQIVPKISTAEPIARSVGWAAPAIAAPAARPAARPMTAFVPRFRSGTPRRS